jgi:osmotically-inducible protein OsmY
MNPKTTSFITASLLAGTISTGATAAQDVVGGVEARAYARPDYEVVMSNTAFTMTEADRALTDQVIQALRQDSRIKGRIEVRALNGKVLLAGTVGSVPMIYRAYEIADRIPAVRYISVDDLDKGHI